MTASTVACFLAASVTLTLAPGPDNTVVIAQGISRGRMAALATAMGMCAGVSIHTTAAALGLSAIIYSSAIAFECLKYAGAAYLLFLAWRAVSEHEAAVALPAPDGRNLRALFRRGFIMNVVNPKVGLFFLAFLPHFVTPASKSPAVEMLLLGIVFMLQGIVVFGAIALLAGSFGNAVLKKPRIARWFSWISAGIFSALALRLALARR